MSAITDIPAKTPSPMGRTDICFPGSWKAAVAEAVESGAEVAELDEAVLEVAVVGAVTALAEGEVSGFAVSVVEVEVDGVVGLATGSGVVSVD